MFRVNPNENRGVISKHADNPKADKAPSDGGAQEEYDKEPAGSSPQAPSSPEAKQAFTDLELAFFEEDLQRVEEVDNFEDLFENLPETDSPWGRFFTRGKKRSDSD